MKNRQSIQAFTKTIAGVAALACVLTASAANYTWDIATGDSAITDGGGTWQVGSGNWYNGTTYDQDWADGNAAVFGTGTSGAAGTVTLGGNITATSITFDAPFAGKYTIDTAANTLTVGNITANSNSGAAPVVIQSGVGGSIAISGTGMKTWSVTGANALTVSSKITGSAGIQKFGAGDLTLTNDDNSFSGGISANNSSSLFLSSIRNTGVNSAGGSAGIIGVGNSGNLRYTGSGDSTDRTLVYGVTAGSLFSQGTGPIRFLGTFSNNAATTRTFNIRGTNKDLNEIAGNITDNGAGVLSIAKGDAGTWKLSGNNTYTGATALNNGTLVFANKAARSASTTVTAAAAGTVGLGVGAGGATDYSDTDVAALFNATLTGFSLDPSTGVALDTTAGNFTQSTPLTAARALTKLGANTLTLSGANTYTGITTLNAGIVQADVADVASTSGALGNGGNITFAGGTLQYTANSEATDYSARIKNSTSAIALDTNGRDATLAINLSSDNTGGLTKAGEGTLIVQFESAYTGLTTVNGGTLQLDNNTANITWGAGNFKINNGSTLKINSVATTTIQGRTFTFGSTGGGTIDLIANNPLWRNSTIATTGGAKNTVSGSSSFNMQNTYSALYTVADGTDDVDLEVAVNHERGAIVKNGDGVLALTSSVNNMYQPNNTITINAGKLEVAGSGRLKSGNYALGIMLNNDGIFEYNSSANQILGGVIGGSGSLIQSGSGTLTLTNTNTYTGNTMVSAGTLNLSDNAELRFVIKGTGTNNVLTGSGIVTLDGDFRLDLTGAGTTEGDSWTIMDVGNLSETFGATFSLLSTLGSFTEYGNVWKIQENGIVYLFSESTGVLRVPPRGTLISIF